MSDGEQTVIPAPAKPEHHATKKKRENKEMHDLMETVGVSSIADLRAMILAANTLPAQAPQATMPGDPVAVVPTEYHDDLAWITPDVYAVHFVSNSDVIVVRAAKPKWHPPMEKIQITSHGRGPWHAMPFKIECREDRDHEKNQKALYTSKWKYHVLTREMAVECYMDERWPMPQKAVIDSEKFRRWNGLVNRAEGEYVELIDPDPLREMMRVLLQRRHGMLFVNAGHHVNDGMDPRIPNPYGRTLAGYKAPEVTRIQRDGVSSA